MGDHAGSDPRFTFFIAEDRSATPMLAVLRPADWALRDKAARRSFSAKTADRLVGVTEIALFAGVKYDRNYPLTVET